MAELLRVDGLVVRYRAMGRRTALLARGHDPARLSWLEAGIVIEVVGVSGRVTTPALPLSQPARRWLERMMFDRLAPSSP